VPVHVSDTADFAPTTSSCSVRVIKQWCSSGTKEARRQQFKLVRCITSGPKQANAEAIKQQDVAAVFQKLIAAA